jgi:carboxypeptidase C (cathepsin A)
MRRRAAATRTPMPRPTARRRSLHVLRLLCQRGAKPQERPITFLYNGGPGSSTVWLHMGAFGPKRVVTADDTHTPAAPYKLIDNDESLLDASDLVFIDAPGTGFSRIAGKDKEKAFYGVDPDAHAFSSFIQEFLSKYGRWNSPKYLFGESYGTPRSAVVVNDLETNHDIDFNGVILLSQILNFDLSASTARRPIPATICLTRSRCRPMRRPPGIITNCRASSRRISLPSCTSSRKLGDERLRVGPAAGHQPVAGRRNAVAQKLHEVTGLPVAYILKANLRIDGGEFEKNLQDDAGMTTGRLDTRFSGHHRPAEQGVRLRSAIGRHQLGLCFGLQRLCPQPAELRPGQDLQSGNRRLQMVGIQAQAAGHAFAFPGATNVMPDIADAMKYNPNLKILLNGGYYDLATPYYEGWYEMHQLPIPENLANNIQYRYYQSGHMVYAHEQSLKELHDNVAAFIRQTQNTKQ